MIGYAICTVGRSGSNWLCELLASTDQLGRPAEYFNPVARRKWTDPDFPDDPAKQLERVLTTGSTANGVYGIKLLPTQVDAARSRVSWSDALPNLHFVHLHRNDLLGQAISLCRSNQTGRFRSNERESVPPQFDGPAVLANIRLFAQQEARWAMFFARNGIAPLRLVYENILVNPQAAVDSIADFLQIERPLIDLSRVRLTLQRDNKTEDWRKRFLAEFRNLNFIDQIVGL